MPSAGTIGDVSFDPQNPRGAPRPAAPASPPPATPPLDEPRPTAPPNRSPRSGVVSAAVVVIGSLVVLLLVALNLAKHGASPIPTIGASNLPSGTAPSGATSSQPASSAASGLTSPLASASGSSSAIPALQPSPGTPEADLLTHIPAAIASSCTTAPASGSVVVSATCSVDAGGITVTYSEYDSADAMNAAYTKLRLDSQIESGTGTCEDHSTWPAEGPYNVENAPAGRRLCTDQPGSPTIFWTDDRLNFLSQASSQTTDYTRLVDFWTNEAGPVL